MREELERARAAEAEALRKQREEYEERLRQAVANQVKQEMTVQQAAARAQVEEARAKKEAEIAKERAD